MWTVKQRDMRFTTRRLVVLSVMSPMAHKSFDGLISRTQGSEFYSGHRNKCNKQCNIARLGNKQAVKPAWTSTW